MNNRLLHKVCKFIPIPCIIYPRIQITKVFSASQILQRYCRVLGLQKTFTSIQFHQNHGLIEMVFRIVYTTIDLIDRRDHGGVNNGRLRFIHSWICFTNYGTKIIKFFPHEISFGSLPKNNQVHIKIDIRDNSSMIVFKVVDSNDKEGNI